MEAVTATEFQNNVGKYLKQVQHGDVIITRNGVQVARLTQDLSSQGTPYTDSLAGLIKGYETATLDDIRAARREKYEV